MLLYSKNAYFKNKNEDAPRYDLKIIVLGHPHAKNGPLDHFLNAWTVLQEVIKLSVSRVFFVYKEKHNGIDGGNVVERKGTKEMKFSLIY